MRIGNTMYGFENDIAGLVREIVAEVADVDPEKIQPTESLSFYGIDSMDLLVVRESLERALRTTITDRDWAALVSGSVGEIIDFAGRRRPGSGRALEGRIPPPSQAAMIAAPQLQGTDRLVTELEIGMPHTGRNNLAETPLLQFIGDQRWRHITALTGVPSKAIVDEEGARLYSTFFYIETSFPQSRPMAAFAENDRLRVVSDLESFGGSTLDGVSYLFPSNYQGECSFSSIEDANAAEVPAVRISNVFVKQFNGAEWLKRARPAAASFAAIPQAAVPPDSFGLVKDAQDRGSFAVPSSAFVAMTDGTVGYEYSLLPDRDLNGVGLVYFANYPLFLDIAEREALRTARLSLPDQLIDRRTLVRRRSAYLNNASSKDKLLIETAAWVENPYQAGAEMPEMAPIRLFINSTMRRMSDGRQMMISTAEKLIFSTALEEAPFFPALKNIACYR